MNTYIASLINPFDASVQQPKLLDGKVDRSAGIRLRRTGELTLKADGPSYIAFWPGFSNGIAWRTQNTPNFPPPYPSHVGSSGERSLMRQVRLVSSGLKFWLMNSADQNDGYFECARIPLNVSDFTSFDGANYANDIDTTILEEYANNLVNFATYQTGKIKDLHRFLFKLNSRDNDHDFTTCNGPDATSQSQAIDQSFDVIIFKLYGRTDVTTPTVLKWDIASNQEVVYKEGTSLSRLQGRNQRVPQMSEILRKTNFISPSIQAS